MSTTRDGPLWASIAATTSPHSGSRQPSLSVSSVSRLSRTIRSDSCFKSARSRGKVYCRKCFGSSSAAVNPRSGELSWVWMSCIRLNSEPLMSAARLGGPVPDVALEAALLVAIRQLERTGGLARPGHAVEEHAALRRCAAPTPGWPGASVAAGPRTVPARFGKPMPRPTRGRSMDSKSCSGGTSWSSAARRPTRMGVTGESGGFGVSGSSASSSARCSAAGNARCLVQQLLVERQHQVGGELVAHRVAHCQRGTIQPQGQRLGQAGQCRSRNGALPVRPRHPPGGSRTGRAPPARGRRPGFRPRCSTRRESRA